MLKKLEFCYNDGEKRDIKDEKIYWDTIRNQFRHKFNCDYCGKSLDCMCYDSLSSALSGVFDGLVCDDCGIKYALDELSIDDICSVLDGERMKKVDEFIELAVSKIERGTERLGWLDKIEIIEDGDKEDELREFCIGLLTKDEKWDMWADICDGYPDGESCNV